MDQAQRFDLHHRLAKAEGGEDCTISAAYRPTDDGALVRVTVSIGVTEVRPENDSFEEALMRADQALYKAKDGGRNRVIDG